ncbi:MAG: trimethylamine methyltransferase family protein [Candidatus Aminicenantes bacterium]|nr:trimethylamine methyltransferase family protein [Candidatus Aminicenantes bacterium]
MSARPILKFLSNDLIERIISESRDILCKLGTRIHNKQVLALLSDHGATVDLENFHVIYTNEIIDNALKSVPSAFKLYDVLGDETHDFSDYNVYFTPGSTALHILDGQTDQIRKPTTHDYIRYAKVVSGLDFITSQSTAFIPSDVVEKISDSYRLYLSLLYCEKPVVTGTFTVDAFNVMRDLQLIVRGSENALREKPLTVFSCCPTSPLKWSDVTSQNVVDCAQWGIPVEFISMPLSGFIAPVTLVGTLVGHTAETLSGIVISQLSNPGAPVLYGGSPAAFDIRYETTPMGAVETQMIDCAYNEIGKYLGIPTQAYISLSDSKRLDAQAGLESSMGATLAALSGINNIAGPGMLDFENCLSLEKLVLDNEICGMVLRMIKGIQPKEDFPSLPLFQELLQEKHLLISSHTRKYLKEEHYWPGKVIDRANLSRWQEEGGLSLGERALSEVNRIIDAYQPSRLSDDIKNQLTERMKSEAHKHDMEKLPQR